MKNYYVEWSINVTADSPEHAARLAQEIQRDPTSSATVFEVIENDNDERILVDLDELDELDDQED